MFEESRLAATVYENAACSDDWILYETQERYLVKLAIIICNTCPVRRQCIEFMAPHKNAYDGVVGGFLWKDGARIDVEGQELLEAYARKECGTPYGYEKHRRASEKSCPACLVAVREQKARNRALSELRRNTTLRND